MEPEVHRRFLFVIVLLMCLYLVWAGIPGENPNLYNNIAEYELGIFKVKWIVAAFVAWHAGKALKGKF